MDTVMGFCDSEDPSVVTKYFGKKALTNSSGLFKNIGKEPREIEKEDETSSAPSGKVKFGDNEVVIFDKNEGIKSLEKDDSLIAKSDVAPRPILKTRSEANWAKNQKANTQEMAFEVFCRCCILCNISVDKLDENDPSKSLKAFFKDIEKAFAAKDKFHKYIRREEKKELSQRWQNSERILESNRDEIKGLTADISSINNENSVLRSENSKLQTSEKRLTDELRNAHSKLEELENIRIQNVELDKQNEKSKDQCNELTKGENINANDRIAKLRSENFELQATKDQLADELTRSLEKLKDIEIQNTELIGQNSRINDQFEELTRTHRLLEEQNADICQLNKELNAALQKMTSEQRGLKDDSRLETLRKDMSDKLLKAHAKLQSVEVENSKLTNDLKDLKNAFKKNLEEIVDENLGLRSQIKTCQTDFKQLQGKYNAMDFKQKEIIEEREKLANDSRRYFEKTLKLQFQLDEHKKFKEQATKFSVEKNECQRKLKKLEYDYCTLQKSSHQLFLQSQKFLAYQRDSDQIIEDMGSKITNLETAREINAFKIDSLTRQISKQTKELGQLQKNNGKFGEKRNLLRSLANTRRLVNDPMTFNRNLC